MPTLQKVLDHSRVCFAIFDIAKKVTSDATTIAIAKHQNLNVAAIIVVAYCFIIHLPYMHNRHTHSNFGWQVGSYWIEIGRSRFLVHYFRFFFYK